MKNTRILLAIIVALVSSANRSGAASLTVNVDFNVTSGIGGLAGTYTGTAAAPDSGTVWNGLGTGTELANVATYSSAASPPLVDSSGGATSVQVQLSNFRPYDSGNTVAPPVTAPALLQDLVAGPSADDPSTPSPAGFTISGLAPGSLYDLYLYSQNSSFNNAQSKFVVGSITKTAVNNGGPGFVDGANYVKYSGLFAAGGKLSGTFQTPISGNAAALNGFQVQFVSTPALSLVYGNSFESSQGYVAGNSGVSAGPGLNNNGGGVSVAANPAYNGQATDGTQFLIFNGGVGVPAGAYFLSSGIGTVNAASYYLTFDFGNWGSGPHEQTISVTVSDAVTSAVLLNTSITDDTPVTAANSALASYALNFTGTGNPIYLLFQDTTSEASTSASATDGLLDNIDLYLVVPEPSTALLLLMGGLLVWQRTRRG